jgi:integrase
MIKPDETRRIGWRARFRDPDSGKLTKVSLDASLTTNEARQEWAVRKSRAIAKRRVELESGAVRATGTKLSDALTKFFKANARLRAGTIDNYQRVADKFEAWATRERILSCDELTRPLLADFRTALINEKRRVHSAGTTRREVRETADPRSAHTVNADLRKIGTVLRYLVELDLFPKLNEGDLRRALKKIPATTERAEYLRPTDCQALLEAALRHDAETFASTREEHAGLRPSGTTPRYDPIAPFVAFVLLTGCRFGEALSVTWKQVDLDALDGEGQAVGEIHLRGADTKTKQARTLDLTVSPALRDLLAGMRDASDGTGRVFELTRPQAEAAAKRLRKEYGAPEGFTWQALRRTCGTYLTNAPGIFGAASAYRSAKQLGHSVQVAERSYLGLERGISRDARTLEAAMQIGDLVARMSVRAMPRADAAQ